MQHPGAVLTEGGDNAGQLVEQGLVEMEDDLEARWETLDKQLQATQSQLSECLERRGQIKSQLAQLADDRRPGQKRLELGCLQRRLDRAVRRWQVLALCGRILATIKDLYEKERQPETLQEASEYLRRLTGGRYKRVWTPLGEDVLRVDDARGNVLPVEALSGGKVHLTFGSALDLFGGTLVKYADCVAWNRGA